MEKRKTAISYIRFSDLRQARGTSLERQIERTRKFCAANGLVLDESVRLRDLGVSGFNGNNVRNGEFAGFLEAVKRGKIAPGTVLVLEAIDRLSRAEMSDAYEIFSAILRAGVEIQTLQPERRYSKESTSNLAGVIEPLVYMSEAYEYSARLSSRVRNATTIQRKQVREGKRPALKKKDPFWVSRHADGSFTLVPEAVARLRQLYEWLAAGLGYHAVAERLNAEGYKTPRGSTWNSQSVRQMVTSLAPLGHYQPRNADANGRRVPDGDPIENYYPQAVPSDLYYSALHAVQRRKSGRSAGRRDKTTRNLFGGLLNDGYSGEPIYYFVERKGQWSARKLAPRSALEERIGKSKKTPIRYDPFEKAFLQTVEGIDPAEVAGKGSGVDEVDALKGKLADLDEKIRSVEAELTTLPATSLAPFLRVLTNLTAQRETAKQDLESARARATNHAVQQLTEFQDCAALLDAAGEGEAADLRTRLRQLLRNTIRQILIYTRDLGKSGHGNKRRYHVLTCVEFQTQDDERGSATWYVTDQDGNHVHDRPEWVREALEDFRTKKKAGWEWYAYPLAVEADEEG